MKNLLALIGLVAIASYVLKIDVSNFLRLFQIPGFNLPGNQQQQQVQQPQDSQSLPQVPQLQQTPQVPQAVQVPKPSPSPNKQWGIGFKGGITTPFGSTKNEVNFGNPDFTDDENRESE